VLTLSARPRARAEPRKRRPTGPTRRLSARRAESIARAVGPWGQFCYACSPLPPSSSVRPPQIRKNKKKSSSVCTQMRRHETKKKKKQQFCYFCTRRDMVSFTIGDLESAVASTYVNVSFRRLNINVSSQGQASQRTYAWSPPARQTPRRTAGSGAGSYAFFPFLELSHRRAGRSVPEATRLTPHQSLRFVQLRFTRRPTACAPFAAEAGQRPACEHHHRNSGNDTPLTGRGQSNVDKMRKERSIIADSPIAAAAVADRNRTNRKGSCLPGFQLAEGTAR
jgi:hypothetical protein